MRLTLQEIAGMTDLSAVRAATTEAEVRATAEVARKHRCICATTGFRSASAAARLGSYRCRDKMATRKVVA